MLSTASLYKIGSSLNDFSRKEKFRILSSSYSEKKLSKLYFHSSFNVNIESTNNYITDDFQISNKKNQYFYPSKGKIGPFKMIMELTLRMQ